MRVCYLINTDISFQVQSNLEHRYKAVSKPDKVLIFYYIQCTFYTFQKLLFAIDTIYINGQTSHFCVLHDCQSMAFAFSRCSGKDQLLCVIIFYVTLAHTQHYHTIILDMEE